MKEKTLYENIVNTEPKLGFSKSGLSKTLPALVGYIQYINSPSGYVFALRSKKEAGSNPPDVDAAMIVRKPVSTELRQVKIDITNEVEQDILALFGDNLENLHDEEDDNRFQERYTTDDISSFFIDFGEVKLVEKTNKEFSEYIESVATDLGTIDITTYLEEDKIVSALGEMQKHLFTKRNIVSGKSWVICSPKIAAYLASKSSLYNANTDVIKTPNPYANSYVTTLGNIDVYISNSFQNEKMVMGILGNANIASIYYMPYKEYISQTGLNYQTGQSDVFFNARDKFITNPLDTFNDSQPSDGTNNDISETANSDYIVSVTTNYTYNLFA